MVVRTLFVPFLSSLSLLSPHLHTRRCVRVRRTERFERSPTAVRTLIKTGTGSAQFCPISLILSFRRFESRPGARRNRTVVAAAQGTTIRSAEINCTTTWQPNTIFFVDMDRKRTRGSARLQENASTPVSALFDHEEITTQKHQPRIKEKTTRVS